MVKPCGCRKRQSRWALNGIIRSRYGIRWRGEKGAF